MTTGIPQRPLLAPWYRIVGAGDRLLLEHAQRVVVLEGAAVRQLLPVLLPLLDGSRTVEELVERVGVPAREAVELALSTLTAHGLLTEGPDAPHSERAGAHALGAAYGLTPSTAAKRLRGAVVGVVGSSAVADDVARLLHADGVGYVRRLTWRSRAAVDLVVVASAADELELLGRWNRSALDAGTRWLPVLPYDGRFAAVGPLIVPHETCCYECLLLRRAANVEYGDDLPELETIPIATSGGAALELLTAATAAHLVVRWVAGRDTTIAGLLHTIETIPVLALGEHTVLRVPRCPACSPVDRLAAPLPWHAAEAA